jgi:hypothetical protein
MKMPNNPLILYYAGPDRVAVGELAHAERLQAEAAADKG